MPPHSTYQSTSFEATGFPSPAQHYTEHQLDLNTKLIRHPAATFFFRLQGHDLAGLGVPHDALLIVDRAESPHPGHLTLAIELGEFIAAKLTRLPTETTPATLTTVPIPPNKPRTITLDTDGDELVGTIIHAITSLPPHHNSPRPTPA